MHLITVEAFLIGVGRILFQADLANVDKPKVKSFF